MICLCLDERMKGSCIAVTDLGVWGHAKGMKCKMYKELGCKGEVMVGRGSEGRGYEDVGAFECDW